MKNCFSILSTIVVFVFTTSSVSAEQPRFHMDMNFQQLLKLFEYKTLNDLGVGETVSVYGVEMCWNSIEGFTSVISSTPISEQPGGIDITRISLDSVNISNFPVPALASEDYKITQFISRMGPHPCDILKTLSSGDVKVLNVAKINGQTTLSGLLSTGTD